MNIQTNMFNRTFDTINIASVFIFNEEPDNYYMKILPIDCSFDTYSNRYTAIDIKTGTPVIFNGDEKVHLCEKATLVIEE